MELSSEQLEKLDVCAWCNWDRKKLLHMKSHFVITTMMVFRVNRIQNEKIALQSHLEVGVLDATSILPFAMRKTIAACLYNVAYAAADSYRNGVHFGTGRGGEGRRGAIKSCIH